MNIISIYQLLPQRAARPFWSYHLTPTPMVVSLVYGLVRLLEVGGAGIMHREERDLETFGINTTRL